jgi:glycerol-3-phosphate dehydrogenase
MKRRLERLAGGTYDLLIIGGGIYGACAAWDAALRGLSVALVEQGDFGGATSANSQKIIHGGLRYLQRLDVTRMRESIRERRTLLRIAPHLVHPMTCLMPTYGWGKRSRLAMRLAFAVNDLVSADRNAGVHDPAQRIPACRLVSREECLRLAPGLHEAGLTGGAVWHDGQVYNSERLTLAFIRSAADEGAAVANYVKVTGFIRAGDRVMGVTAQDALTDAVFEIRSRIVLNTSGPWVNQVLRPLNGDAGLRPVRLVKALNLVTRPLDLAVSLGLESRSPASRTPGLLFITPWRDRAVIGTAYRAYEGHPARCEVTEQEIAEFLAEVNAAYPAAGLTRADLLGAHVGLLPASSDGGREQVAQHFRIIDHRRHGIGGLLSVIGVKYTTARDVAEKTVDRVFDALGRPRPRQRSRTTPLVGGRIARLEPFLAETLRHRPAWVSEPVMRRLVYCYGAAYASVLKWAEEDPGLGGRIIGSADVLRAEVVHAVHEEMAVRLGDVVFRRTDLGTCGRMDARALEECSAIMAEELGWSELERRREVERVRAQLGREAMAAMPSPAPSRPAADQVVAGAEQT